MGILDTVLAHQQRQNELVVEREERASMWVRRFNMEIKVFSTQISNLDFTDRDGREQFYELVEASRSTFRQLRDRDGITALPAEVVLRLDDFIETLEETNRPAGWTFISWEELSPAEERKRERQRKEEEKKLRERTETHSESLSAAIEDIYNALPDDE